MAGNGLDTIAGAGRVVKCLMRDIAARRIDPLEGGKILNGMDKLIRLAEMQRQCVQVDGAIAGEVKLIEG